MRLSLDISLVFFVLSFLIQYGSTTIPRLPGWQLQFYDDFSGPAGRLPNETKWIIQTGTQYPGGPAQWGNEEVQSFARDPANIRLSGQSTLLITPLRDRYGHWTSGRIETRRADFMAPAGRKMKIQGRLRMPNVTTTNGAGYWPCFWTLGAAYRGNYENWPFIGEYDIMENVNGINSVWSGLHCGTNPGGPCDESVGLVTEGSCGSTRCQGNFHQYSVVIDRSVQPEKMSYYVDGRLNREVTEDEIGAEDWDEVAHHPVFMLLDVAMGGNFANALRGHTTPTSATVSGRPLGVDYVAIYYSV